MFPLKILDLSVATTLAGTAVATERYCLGFRNVIIAEASKDSRTTTSICFHHFDMR
jgi:hypothetical protein